MYHYQIDRQSDSAAPGLGMDGWGGWMDACPGELQVGTSVNKT